MSTWSGDPQYDNPGRDDGDIQYDSVGVAGGLVIRPDGVLEVPIRAATEGIYTYVREGRTIRQYRSPEAVRMMAEMLPGVSCVREHSYRTTNDDIYATGRVIGDVTDHVTPGRTVDGRAEVRALSRLREPNAQDEVIKRKRRGVSVGHKPLIRKEAGEWRGQKYDEVCYGHSVVFEVAFCRGTTRGDDTTVLYDSYSDARYDMLPIPLMAVPEGIDTTRYVGVVELCGLMIMIETAAGQVRSGTDPDGVPWAVIMPDHYGELPNTVGMDGDPLDVMVGSDIGSEWAYVFHIKHADGFKDEDKILMGYPSEEAALAAFRAAYNRTDIFGGMTVWPISELVQWIQGHPGVRLDSPLSSGLTPRFDALPTDEDEIEPKQPATPPQNPADPAAATADVTPADPADPGAVVEEPGAVTDPADPAAATGHEEPTEGAEPDEGSEEPGAVDDPADPAAVADPEDPALADPADPTQPADPAQAGTPGAPVDPAAAPVIDMAARIVVLEEAIAALAVRIRVIEETSAAGRITSGQSYDSSDLSALRVLADEYRIVWSKDDTIDVLVGKLGRLMPQGHAYDSADPLGVKALLSVKRQTNQTGTASQKTRSGPITPGYKRT